MSFHETATYLNFHSETPSAMSFSPTSKWLALSSLDSIIFVFGVSRIGTVLSVALPQRHTASALLWETDNYLWAGLTSGQVVCFYVDGTSRGMPVHDWLPYEFKGIIRCMDVFVGRQRLVAVGYNNCFEVWAQKRRFSGQVQWSLVQTCVSSGDDDDVSVGIWFLSSSSVVIAFRNSGLSVWNYIDQEDDAIEVLFDSATALHGVAYNRRQNLFVSVHESSIHVYEAVERRASAYARLKHHKRFDRPVWMATTPLLEAPSVGATPYAAFCSADQLSLWRVDTANLLPPEVNVGIPIRSGARRIATSPEVLRNFAVALMVNGSHGLVLYSNHPENSEFGRKVYDARSMTVPQPRYHVLLLRAMRMRAAGRFLAHVVIAVLTALLLSLARHVDIAAFRRTLKA